ncbi:TaqI-like C-terminal specificity domain-containing protein [Halorubrum lipolyticum]|uniref:TaqI-like C-terminal specificity domain-containing protein n=1 Tax=Halorubrum lipolyticum TaxID=368624 RepID=UPI0009E61854|nr:TaqI-like C-terminal specificity domain-containing protein [Halorubrum lipolyticum]
MYRKNIEILPRPKILTGDLVQRNKLCFDEKGIMAPHNVSVYSFVVDDDKKYVIAGVLNSSLLEYYHKHYSRIHKGKAFRYIEDYISKWPIQIPEGDVRGTIESAIQDILHLKDLEAKIPQFPDPYIIQARESGEEFVNVTFTPDSSFIASPSIQNDLQGDVTLILDDGQSLSEGIDSERKAEYVQEALQGTRLRQNQTVSIPVPLRDDIAIEALTELQEDISERDEGDLDELEQEIDEAVFELYDMSEQSLQEHVYRFNSQHESVQPLDLLE